jgi:AcrR family transcriptional regulator
MKHPHDIFLTTGLLLLDEGEGSTSLSLRKIAEKAGYSHNALYRHYASKEVYLDALTAYGFDLLRLKFEKVTNKNEVMLVYYKFSIQHPELYKLMFQSPKTASQPLRRESGMRTLAFFIEKLGFSLANKSEYQKGVSIWISLHGFILVEKSGMTPRDKQGSILIDFKSFIKKL